VDAFPAHRDLDHAMQLAKRNGRRHVHPAPYHRAEPQQPNLELHNCAGYLRRRCGRWACSSRQRRLLRHALLHATPATRRNRTVSRPAPHFVMLSHQRKKSDTARMYAALVLRFRMLAVKNSMNRIAALSPAAVTCTGISVCLSAIVAGRIFLTQGIAAPPAA